MTLLCITPWLSSAVLLIGLAGCAVTSVPTTPVSSEQRTDSFERSGRFALNVEKADGSRDAVQGGFTWHEQKQNLQLDLTTPMGTVLARLTVDPRGAVLRYPNGDAEYAASPDELVTQLFGYVIPVAGMRDWLRGQTGSSPTSGLQLEQDQPVYFQQDNWRVRLQRYDEKGPRLLQMNRTQAQQNIAVRVVVDY